MAAPSGQMSVAVEDGTAYVAVAGRACAEGARDFKRFVEGRRAEGVRCVVLELSHCLLMDSTFSGVLAGLVSGGDGPALHFVLASPNDRVTDLLDNLGVLPLVEVVSTGQPTVPASGFDALPTSAPDRLADAACCLDAHRLLMALHPENVSRFATLEKYLAAEVERSAAGDPPGGGD